MCASSCAITSAARLRSASEASPDRGEERLAEEDAPAFSIAPASKSGTAQVELAVRVGMSK